MIYIINIMSEEILFRNKKDILTWIWTMARDEPEFKTIIPFGSRDLKIQTSKGWFRIRVSSDRK